MNEKLHKWISPSHCAWCGLEVPISNVLCSRCFAKIISECSSSLHKIHSMEIVPQTPYSAGAYAGRLRQAILLWKKQNCMAMSQHFSELLSYTIPLDIWGSPIVYIPGHPRNIQFRGWDPMQQTARILAELTGGMCLPALVRSRRSKIQKQLDIHQRKLNGKHMFRSNSIKVPAELILIDDIATTGTSILEAADFLQLRGASKIYCFTIAQD